MGRDGERDWGLRIAKLGTRPKGGSPKDNLKAKRQEPAFRSEGRNIGMVECWGRESKVELNDTGDGETETRRNGEAERKSEGGGQSATGRLQRVASSKRY